MGIDKCALNQEGRSRNLFQALPILVTQPCYSSAGEARERTSCHQGCLLDLSPLVSDLPAETSHTPSALSPADDEDSFPVCVVISPSFREQLQRLFVL